MCRIIEGRNFSSSLFLPQILFPLMPLQKTAYLRPGSDPFNEPNKAHFFPCFRIPLNPDVPVVSFRGEIVYSHIPRDVEACVEELREAIRHTATVSTTRSGVTRSVVGFDVQWQPFKRKGV